MLVTIAVIAVIAAFAIPQLQNIPEQARKNTTKRTARTVAAVAGSAQVAGDESIAAAADKKEALSLIVGGVTGKGDFAGQVFRVGVVAEELTAVAEYLQFEDGALVFKGGGS